MVSPSLSPQYDNLGSASCKVLLGVKEVEENLGLVMGNSLGRRAKLLKLKTGAHLRFSSYW